MESLLAKPEWIAQVDDRCYNLAVPGGEKLDDVYCISKTVGVRKLAIA